MARFLMHQPASDFEQTVLLPLALSNYTKDFLIITVRITTANQINTRIMRLNRISGTCNLDKVSPKSAALINLKAAVLLRCSGFGGLA